jgi:hypothetical protein
VTVSLTVEPVSNVQLLVSGGYEMDRVSQQILKTWKFKPAMCEAEPVCYRYSRQRDVSSALGLWFPKVIPTHAESALRHTSGFLRTLNPRLE